MLGIITSGTRVTGSDWNDIGEVKYLITHPGSGQVTGLVVKTNTFEESYKLIEMEMVSRLFDQGKFVTIELTRDQVELLPEFERNEYTGMPECSGVSNPILY